MSDAILRQSEAWEFVRSIHEPKERLLLELAVARALSFLVTDAEYRVSFRTAPMDLLMYARATHAFLKQQDLLQRVLDGRVSSVDDLNPFPES